MIRSILIVLMFAAMSALLYAITPPVQGYDGPLRLAAELIHGRPYLPEFITWIEMFRHDGRDYIAYPPMVSFILTPYTWLGGAPLGQPLANTILIIGSAILFYWYVKSLPGIERFAVVAPVAYVLCTPVLYSASNGNVWLLMHSEGNFFLLLALLFTFRWRSRFIAGFMYMIAAQARYSIILTGVVFVILFLQQAPRGRRLASAFRSCVIFGLGALPPLIAVLAFQWWTLGDPLVSPYALGWREWGFAEAQFSLDYVERNFWLYAIAVPTFLATFPYLRFDATGQTIFAMSPFFLGIFTTRIRLAWAWAFVPGIVLMVLFYLAYFWTGFSQLGTRYMTDLYPFLIPLALAGFSRPGRFWRIALGLLLVVAALLNAYAVFLLRYYQG